LQDFVNIGYFEKSSLHPAMTYKISPSNHISHPWKHCFGPPGVWKPLVGNH